MPAIIVNSLELTNEQKSELAMAFTSAFSKVTRVPMDRIYVFFAGYPLDSAAKGGELFLASPPEGIIGKFNQDGP